MKTLRLARRCAMPAQRSRETRRNPSLTCMFQSGKNTQLRPAPKAAGQTGSARSFDAMAAERAFEHIQFGAQQFHLGADIL